MNKKALFGGGLFVLAISAVSGFALADGGAPAHGRDPAALVQRFDANKDGKLQVTELPARMQQRLGGADANKDGVLAVDEIKAFREAKMKAHFATMDKNSDGGVDATEAGARWAHLQVADANKDGKVTLPELEAARAAGLMHHEGGRGHRGQGRGHRR